MSFNKPIRNRRYWTNRLRGIWRLGHIARAMHRAYNAPAAYQGPRTRLRRRIRRSAVGRSVRRRYNRRVPKWGGKIGYYGSRQISRRAKYVRFPKTERSKVSRFVLANCDTPLNLKPWEGSQTFYELQWNGFPVSQTSYSTKTLTTSSAPSVGSSASQREGIRIGPLTHRMRLCINSGSGVQLAADEKTVLREDKALCCRMLVIQVFGDSDDIAAGTCRLDGFFHDNNITSYMKGNIGELSPQLKRFKILVDKTFTTSDLDAHTADRHVNFTFNQGACEFGSDGNNTGFVEKGSRILWGLFHEDVNAVGANNLEEAMPSFYGDYKISWRDIKG